MDGTTVENKLKETSLRDFYYILFRHKKKVIIFFFVVVITVTLGTFLSPEIYQSNAKLLLTLGRESVALDPTASTGKVVNVTQFRDVEINSELEILKNRDLAEEIVDRLGVEAILKRPDEILLGETSQTGIARDAMRKTRKEFRDLISKPGLFLAKIDIGDTLKKHDKAVVRLMNNLTVNVQKTNNIISISYDAQSPQLAHSVIVELIDSFLEKHMEVHYSKGTYDFFIDQTDKLRNELKDTEKSLTDLKSKTGIASLDEQRTIILTRIGDLQREIDQNNALMAATRAKVQSLKKITSDLPEMVERDRTMGNLYMNSDVFKLQLEEQNLLSKYSEENIKVKEIRRQIAEAKGILNSNPQITEGINTTNQQLQLDLHTEQSNLESFRSRAIELNNIMANAKTEIDQLNENEAKILELVRERDLKVVDYLKYSDNLEQARIDQALQKQKLSNIRIIQSATYPMKPIRPQKLLNLSLGLFLAFFGSIGYAFFSEYIDHSIKTLEDVDERLQLRVLIAIPKI